MYKLAVSFVAMLFLSGCASPTWNKSGVSRHDTHTALSQCKYEIGLNKVSDSKSREMIRNCMEGKGFRWR